MNVAAAVVVDVALVLMVTIAGAAMLRRWSAASRHTVLTAGVVAALLVPLLELVVPQQPVVRWSAEATADPAASALTGGDVTAVPFTPLATEPAAPPIPVAAVLFSLWTAGALVALAALIVGFVRLSRAIAASVPVQSGTWRTLADEIARNHGIARPVRLLQGRDSSLLVTCGVWRPVILLPEGAAAWPADRCRVVLAHELAHIRRRDAATQLAGELLRVLHWFNPIVWIACRRLRQESEYACDDVVLGSGVGAADYADHLLGIARAVAIPRFAWRAAAGIAQPSTLERRVIAMLNRDRNRAPLAIGAQVLAILGTATVAVAIAAADVASPVAADRDIVPRDVALPASAPDPAPAPGTDVPPVNSSANAVPRGGGRVQAAATVSGTVVDESGGTLPGVTITLTNTTNGDQRQLHTNVRGDFEFTSLPAARYELQATLVGFRPWSEVKTIAGNEGIQSAITLQVQAFSETLDVICGEPESVGLAARLGRLWAGAMDAFVPGLAAQAPATPIRVGGNIKVPRRTTVVTPPCPQMPLGAPVEVRLAGRLGADGRLRELTPVAGDGGGVPPVTLVQATIDAVAQWTLTPVQLNGKPYDAEITITIAYRPGASE